MSYAEYGLDTVKKSQDEGAVGKSYCPWCQRQVTTGFSLCFSNFCICPDCVVTAVDQTKRWKKDDGHGCFKCCKTDKNKVHDKLFFDKASSLSICQDCIDWAKQVLKINQPIMATENKNDVPDVSGGRSRAEAAAHTDQDLREFRILIEKKKEVAQQELAFLVSKMDEGSFPEDFPEEKLKLTIERQHEFIASLDAKLTKIQEKTFGVTGAGKLVPKAKIVEVITSSKSPAEEVPPAPEAAEEQTQAPPERRCRKCGCTDNDCRQCVEKTGLPCSWVEEDLCSACVEETKAAPAQVADPVTAPEPKATASPEAIQLPDNVKDMEFFKQLAAATKGVDVSITLKEKNGKFTMSLLPNVGDGSRVKPLLVTATPEELDTDFFNLVTRPLHEAARIISNAEDFKKSVTEAVEEDKPKPAPKKATKPAPKKAAPKNDKKASRVEAAKKAAATKAAKKQDKKLAAKDVKPQELPLAEEATPDPEADRQEQRVEEPETV